MVRQTTQDIAIGIGTTAIEFYSGRGEMDSTLKTACKWEFIAMEQSEGSIKCIKITKRKPKE